jgi:hypothetical protein
MKKLIKIVLILGGVIIGGYTIAELLAVLSKCEGDDDDVEYCNYDDLECMPNIDDVSLAGNDDIDIDVD